MCVVRVVGEDDGVDQMFPVSPSVESPHHVVSTQRRDIYVQRCDNMMVSVCCYWSWNDVPNDRVT